MAETTFLALLKHAVQAVQPKDIEEFFETNFLKAINTQLDSSPQTPAESLRQHRIQTQKIKNFLLTLRGK